MIFSHPLLKLGEKWWSDLSIKEMKALFDKYYPNSWSVRWHNAQAYKIVKMYEAEHNIPHTKGELMYSK